MPETGVMFLSDLGYPEKALVSWEHVTFLGWHPIGQG